MAATLKPKAQLQKAAEEAAEKLNAVSREMAEEIKSSESKKEKSKEQQLLTLNVSKSQYEGYKKLFGGAGYSLAKGTRMCLDYVYREIESGKLELTESGLRETLSSRLNRK